MCLGPRDGYALDRAAGAGPEAARGIPPGTLLAFTAPPDTQSELVREELARTHDATYVTTVRDPAAVEERLPDPTVRGAAPEELLKTRTSSCRTAGSRSSTR